MKMLQRQLSIDEEPRRGELLALKGVTKSEEKNSVSQNNDSSIGGDALPSSIVAAIQCLERQTTPTSDPLPASPPTPITHSSPRFRNHPPRLNSRALSRLLHMPEYWSPALSVLEPRYRNLFNSISSTAESDPRVSEEPISTTGLEGEALRPGLIATPTTGIGSSPCIDSRTAQPKADQLSNPIPPPTRKAETSTKSNDLHSDRKPKGWKPSVRIREQTPSPTPLEIWRAPRVPIRYPNPMIGSLHINGRSGPKDATTIPPKSIRNGATSEAPLTNDGDTAMLDYVPNNRNDYFGPYRKASIYEILTRPERRRKRRYTSYTPGIIPHPGKSPLSKCVLADEAGRESYNERQERREEIASLWREMFIVSGKTRSKE